jgi:hypothetical protein
LSRSVDLGSLVVSTVGVTLISDGEPLHEDGFAHREREPDIQS